MMGSFAVLNCWTVAILPLQTTGYLKMSFLFQVTSLSCRTSSRGSRVSWECSSRPKARIWWIINRGIRCKAWWCSIQPCRLIRYLGAVREDVFSWRMVNLIKFLHHTVHLYLPLGSVWQEAFWWIRFEVSFFASYWHVLVLLIFALILECFKWTIYYSLQWG